MTPRMLAAALLYDMLLMLDVGVLTVSVVGTPWKETWRSNVRYALSNGWAFEVFVDGGSWDYVDKVTTPLGDTFEIEACDAAFNWMPDGDVWLHMVAE